MKIIKVAILLLIIVISTLINNYCQSNEIRVGSELSTLVRGMVVPFLIPSIIDLTDITKRYPY